MQSTQGYLLDSQSAKLMANRKIVYRLIYYNYDDIIPVKHNAL